MPALRHLLILAALLAVAGPAAAEPAEAQDSVRTFQVQVETRAESTRTADRDSLMSEIRRYTAMIGDLRDSLETGRGELRFSPEQKLRLEESIGEISKVVERISAELGRMEFEVRDNTISLLDEAGEGIVITIPENLDEQLSEGFHALSEIILSELPDTVRMDAQRHLTWLGKKPPKPPASARKLVQGDIVKVGDDLLVAGNEDVRGDVVVVMGNAEIRGRVDGTVVVILGNLQLGEDAEVTGEVVAVGGRLDRAEGAVAGGVTVIDPVGSRRSLTPQTVLGGGVRGFLLSQAFFLAMLVVAVIAAVATPEARFQAMERSLAGAPAVTFGIGLLAAIGGHVVAIVLIAVLVLTVIGIPVALLAWLLMVILGVVATAVVASLLGEKLLGAVGWSTSGRWVRVLVGVAMLHTLSLLGGLLGVVGGGAAAVGLSAVGFMVKVTAYLLGLGALASTRFGSSRPPSASTST